MRYVYGLMLVAVCMNPIAATELDATLARMERLRTKHEVPGAALIIVDADTIIWSGGFGVADLDSRAPMRAETLIRIGSITKSFTSLAMLMLEQDGLLRLQDPVTRYLPKPPYQNPWHRHPVRIAYLLEHTAGLTDLSKREFDNKDPTPLTLEQAFSLDPAARVLRWPAGRHSSYSTAGAGIAGLVLEHVTGQSFESWMDARVFQPLGMRRTNLLLDERVRSELATGYDTDGRTPIPYWHMVFRPFGAINTTVEEMSAFIQLLINRGRYQNTTLLPPEAIQRMEDPQTTLAARDGLRYGYGLGNFHYVYDGHVLHGHGGDADGYLAHFAYSNETKRGFLLVINAFKKDALRAMREPVEDFIVAGGQQSEPPESAVSSESLRRLTGVYVPATQRFEWLPEANKCILISFNGKRLYTRLGDHSPRALIAVTDTHFRRSGQPVATAAFVHDEEGQLYLQGDMGNYQRVDGQQARDCR
jgi:CubicO group peptidase (beta-lactamase class C family)